MKDKLLAAIADALKAYEPDLNRDDVSEFDNIEIVDGEILLNIDGESVAIQIEVL